MLCPFRKDQEGASTLLLVPYICFIPPKQFCYTALSTFTMPTNRNVEGFEADQDQLCF